MLKIGQNYDLLCNMIIRPPRFIYEVADLGPRYFVVSEKPAQRTDFELVNGRGLILQCSHFEPLTSWDHPMPCVIYLHGNGGCRIEALDAVRTLLPCNMSVFALDFAGSGLSAGAYVSLGALEKQDVATVVQYLRDTKRCSTIGLWGRSMGAVTAILYSIEDPSIASMLLDSPFCSLQKIAEDLVMNIETLQKMPRFTKFAVSLAMKPIRATIKKKAEFDIKVLEILDVVPKCFIPALFVHSRDDNFVLPVHSELLYSKYTGDKNRVLVDGDHNSIRPDFFMHSAAIFFMNTLRAEDIARAPQQQSPLLQSLPSQTRLELQPQEQERHLHEHLHQQHQQQQHQMQQIQHNVQHQLEQRLSQSPQRSQHHHNSNHNAHGLALDDIGVSMMGGEDHEERLERKGHNRDMQFDVHFGDSVIIAGEEVYLGDDDCYPPYPTTPLNPSYSPSNIPPATTSTTSTTSTPPTLPSSIITDHANNPHSTSGGEGDEGGEEKRKEEREEEHTNKKSNYATQEEETLPKAKEKKFQEEKN